MTEASHSQVHNDNKVSLEKGDTTRGGFLDKKYGYFDTDNHEFVITRYDTPRPWANYITNGKLSGIITNAAGGFSFYASPRLNRITRWRYNSLPPDRPGRYIYLRDNDTGEYWSPTWQPTMTPLEKYRCRHGFNYTIFESSYSDIESTVTYFVTPSDDVEIWWVSLKNTGKHTRNLNVYSYVELCLGHSLVDLINQPNDQHFNEVSFDQEHGILHGTKRYWVAFNQATVKQANYAWAHRVFMASSLGVTGFDGSKDTFIGRWRSEQNPTAVENGKSYGTEITAGDAVFALQHDISLEPREATEFPVILGIVPTETPLKNIANVADTYRDIDNVRKQFDMLNAQRDEYLGAVRVDIPDPVADMMVNFWNQYQVKTTFQFSRDASLYHGGLLFGRGYRDSAQDSLGPLMTKPGWVKERLFEMAKMQFNDGSTYHLYYPVSGGGERTEHMDNPLWLPFLTMSYLKEAAEFSILEHEFEFLDGGKAPLLEHVKRAVDYVAGNLSPRNLVLFKGGDWNDTLDFCGRQGKGESLWMSMFFAFILREVSRLLEVVEYQKEARHYKELYDTLADAINTHAWDGEWYIRGTNDWGELVGSQDSDEGKIFLNAQSWSIISGIAPPERAAKAMASVARILATPKGPKILHPPYSYPNEHIGLATRCVQGKKENGAVFNHTVAWAIMAELLLGNGERAWEYYRRALPMNPVVDIDRYEVEPYVYSEYVTSPDHPTFGQASHSWLTGSATWMLSNIVNYLLGVRADYEGLLVDPCLPPSFTRYTIKRTFRGATYNITVDNPDGVAKGKLDISVDGNTVQSNILPVFSDGKTHEVNVTL